MEVYGCKRKFEAGIFSPQVDVMEGSTQKDEVCARGSVRRRQAELTK